MSVHKSNTIFCDIDGTIFRYRKFQTYTATPAELLPGSKDKLDLWYAKGNVIILTTARPEYLRYQTEKELNSNNIKYHQLVMGLGRGKRYLINDHLTKDDDRAIGCNITTNEGLINVDI